MNKDKSISAESKPHSQVRPGVGHTPTPWVSEGGPLVSKAGTLILVADCEQFEDDGTDNELAAANAAFIARAANNFDSLLEACRQVSRSADSDCGIYLKYMRKAVLEIRKAIAAAEAD